MGTTWTVGVINDGQDRTGWTEVDDTLALPLRTVDALLQRVRALLAEPGALAPEPAAQQVRLKRAPQSVSEYHVPGARCSSPLLRCKPAAQQVRASFVRCIEQISLEALGTHG